MYLSVSLCLSVLLGLSGYIYLSLYLSPFISLAPPPLSSLARFRNVASTATWSDLGSAARETLRAMRPIDRALWDQLRGGHWSLKMQDIPVVEIIQDETVVDNVKAFLY